MQSAALPDTLRIQRRTLRLLADADTVLVELHAGQSALAEALHDGIPRWMLSAERGPSPQHG